MDQRASVVDQIRRRGGRDEWNSGAGGGHQVLHGDGHIWCSRYSTQLQKDFILIRDKPQCPVMTPLRALAPCHLTPRDRSLHAQGTLVEIEKRVLLLDLRRLLPADAD